MTSDSDDNRVYEGPIGGMSRTLSKALGGDGWTWEQIRDYISLIEGKEITRQSVQQQGERAKMKMGRALIKDPIIREWLADKGLIPVDEV